MNCEVKEAQEALYAAIEAYRKAMNQAASECSSFRDKYEHYHFNETTVHEVESILRDIDDHAEDAQLCNTSCHICKSVGGCPYHLRHEECPRYVERLTEAGA